MRRLAPLVAAATLALLGACNTDVAPAPGDRVRAVVMPYLTFMPMHIAAHEGYFEAQGLEVEFVNLARIQELMVGLARGDVDVAAGMVTVNVLNSIASGARVRLVGEQGYLAVEHCSFNALVARRDLLDSGALGSAAQLRELVWDADLLLPYGYWIDRAVGAYGLGVGDLNLVNLPEAAAIEALRSGSIDVTLVSEPYLGMLAGSAEADIWQPSSAIVPDYPISVVMFGPDLLEARREVGERFAAALLAGMRRYLEGKTPANLAIVQRASGLDEDLVRAACWPAARADGRLDPERLRAYQEWAVAHGYLARVLEAAEIYDGAFFESAVRKLDSP